MYKINFIVSESVLISPFDKEPVPNGACPEPCRRVEEGLEDFSKEKPLSPPMICWRT